MAVNLEHPHLSGNGRLPLPLSKRAFQRALPHRLGGVEDHLDAQKQRVDELVSRLAAIEARWEDMTLSARAYLVEQVVDLLRLVLGKRRSRRRAK
jgi:hypothetical protein